MTTVNELAKEFLAQKTIAVAGVSGNREIPPTQSTSYCAAAAIPFLPSVRMRRRTTATPAIPRSLRCRWCQMVWSSSRGRIRA